MSTKKVRVGIIGAGAMGAEHAFCYSLIEGVEVAGIFSRNPQRASAVAQQWKTTAFADPARLIDDESIDAIDVCVPSVHHREFVVAALKKGKHVFCETPFALSLADADAMMAAAQDAKRILQVGLLLRSAAHYEHLQRVAASGEHGAVLSVVAFRLGSYLRPGAPDHKAHYTDPSTELMTFDFDVVISLLGQPRRLTANAVTTKNGTPGEISALLDFDDAKSATVLASGIMPATFPFTAGCRVVFERAAYELVSEFGEGGPPQTVFRFFPKEGSAKPVDIVGHNPYEKELRHFVDCVRDGTQSAILGPEHAVAALKLSLATQRALRERTAVTLD